MAGEVVLRCAALDVSLILPWWPAEVSGTYSGWNVNTLDRPGRTPLEVPSSRTVEEMALGFTLRKQDYTESISGRLTQLRRIAAQNAPVQLLMGDRDTGLWRMEPPTITELAWAADGSPSVADVDLVLKRASDAIVKVGPIKRIRGRATGVSRQR